MVGTRVLVVEDDAALAALVALVPDVVRRQSLAPRADRRGEATPVAAAPLGRR